MLLHMKLVSIISTAQKEKPVFYLFLHQHNFHPRWISVKMDPVNKNWFHPYMSTKIFNPFPVHIYMLRCSTSVWRLTCTSRLETALPSPLTWLFRFSFACFHSDMVCVSSSSSVKLDPWLPSCHTLRTRRRMFSRLQQYIKWRTSIIWESMLQSEEKTYCFWKDLWFGN